MRERIAFISEHASPLATLGGVDNGGQNVYVAELAKELAQQDYIIDIYTRRDSSATPEVVHWLPKIRVIHVAAGPAEFVAKEDMLQYMPAFADEMISFIGRNFLHYNLVHANFFMSALVASEVKRQLRIPYVVTFHALGLVRQAHQKEADRFPAERLAIEKFIVNDADGIVAECPQDREDLIQLYDAASEKISVIQCGFNPCEFYPIDKAEARSKLGISASEFVVLQLGRMVPRKGIDNVIRSLRYLKSSDKSVRLLVVGGECCGKDVMETPEIKRLTKIATTENVLSHLTFTGREDRDKLRYYYAAADVFVTTPWYEPFGITPLEAMACGTPVIGSNVGGIKYSVVDGHTGFLVPPDAPATLAKKILQLVTDPSLLKIMSNNAIARAREIFTWQSVASAMTVFYRVIIQHAYAEKIMIWHDTSRGVMKKMIA
jgi:D-inositol-3-phosphate glycosyltransferase